MASIARHQSDASAALAVYRQGDPPVTVQVNNNAVAKEEQEQEETAVAAIDGSAAVETAVETAAMPWSPQRSGCSLPDGGFASL